MNSRNTGIIATIVTALCCGCPGLFSVCWGGIAAFASLVPGADIDINGSSDPQTAMLTGIGALCFGLIFIIIPIVVGVVTLRRKPAEAVVASVESDSLPPAS